MERRDQVEAEDPVLHVMMMLRVLEKSQRISTCPRPLSHALSLPLLLHLLVPTALSQVHKSLHAHLLFLPVLLPLSLRLPRPLLHAPLLPLVPHSRYAPTLAGTWTV